MKPKKFEDKLEYSKEILEKLSSPNITLDEAMKLYEDGIKNIKDAQNMIEKAKVKIETIEQKHFGNING